MKFFTDHYFHIGSAHYTSGKPCQDYALTGSNEFMACAIVSDGCSSGRHTDVGSRILVLSTLQAIRDYAKASGGALDTAVVSISARQQQIIGAARLMLGLDPLDMLATCGYVYLTSKGGFVHVQGDGVVAMKYRDGRIKMVRLDWADNMPFYPSYTDGELGKFVEVHGGKLDASRLVADTVIRNVNGIAIDERTTEYTLRQGLEGVFFGVYQPEDLEFIAVFSDGVTQIENVDWRDAVTNLLSFKSLAGDFAKRRMIRELKAAQQLGRGPIDDISFAVVRIDHGVDKEDGDVS